MPSHPPLPAVLTLRETADALRVHPNTVRRWLADGHLAAVQIGKRRTYRIQRDEVLRILTAAPPAETGTG